MTEQELTIETLNKRLKRVEDFLNEFIPKYEGLVKSHAELKQRTYMSPVIGYDI